MLDMKNANKVKKKKITKDKMTYFDISVAVKHRKDNNEQRKWTSL